MTDKFFPWMEGTPTRPDVDALFKAYPPESMVSGWEITDDQIKEVVGDTPRLNAIRSAWRNRLRTEHSVTVYRRKNAGFFVPNNQEIFDQASPRLRHVNRTYKKHLREVSVIKPKDEQERSIQDHQGKLMHTLSRETKKARMNLLPSTVAAPVPQIGPPKAKEGK